MSRQAMVTGAGGGIGKAVALDLATTGHALVLADTNRTGLAATAESINQRGGQAVVFPLDVTHRAHVQSLVEHVSTELGTISVLVNCAGNLFRTRVTEISDSEWDLVLDVNLKGTFLCSQAVIGGMAEIGWGRIVNMSSTAGKSVSTLGGAHYTAAKAGILGFTRHLASEVAGLGITVNAVCPGLIDTDMVRTAAGPEQLANYAASFPISRLGKPEEIAALVSFLASDSAAYITGAAIDINGGDLMV